MDPVFVKEERRVEQLNVAVSLALATVLTDLDLVAASITQNRHQRVALPLAPLVVTSTPTCKA